MSRVVRVPAGLNGPATSANGGVAAGVMAALLDGPVEVRLSNPPPIDTDMPVEEEDGWLVARDAGEQVLAVRPVDGPDLRVPELDTAAVGPGAPFPDHPAATCVVCGPAHPRGLGVMPVPVDGTDGVLATWWTPPDWALDDDGVVRDELLWGVLDCPGALAIMAAEDEPVFAALAGITGELVAPVHGDERVLVLGWPLEADGRKRGAATAVLGPDGDVRALTRQLCIALPPAWAAGDG